MKLPFYNAWVKWSINGVPYASRKHKDDICEFVYSPEKSKVGTYKEELLNNAKYARDYFSGKFDVLYSGGVDSEVILRVFKELGIKHNTIIVRYKDGYNHREISHAINSVQSLNIPYKIIDFDLKKFFETEAYDTCIESSCIRAGRSPYIKFCRDFCDNIPVMGEGDVYWYRFGGTDYTKPADWKFMMMEASHNCSMYMTKLGRENLCDFYEFTPNVIKAYNNQPIMQDLLNDKIPGKLSNWSSKWRIHNQLWPDMAHRVKLTGLEGDGVPGTTPEFVSSLQKVVDEEIGPGNTYWYTEEELDNLI